MGQCQTKRVVLNLLHQAKSVAQMKSSVTWALYRFKMINQTNILILFINLCTHYMKNVAFSELLNDQLPHVLRCSIFAND